MKCPNCGSLKYRVEYRAKQSDCNTGGVYEVISECTDCLSKTIDVQFTVSDDWVTKEIANNKFCETLPEVLFQKTNDRAKLPMKNHDCGSSSDTGYDIYSTEDCIIEAKSSKVVDVGLKVAYITPNWWFETRGRSGMAFKKDIVPFIGTIDNGYRGVLGIKLFNLSNEPFEVKTGDRVCQMAVCPLHRADMRFVDESDETTIRGDKGFGNSGK